MRTCTLCVICGKEMGICTLYTTAQRKKEGGGSAKKSKLTQRFAVCTYCLVTKIEGDKSDSRGIDKRIGEDEEDWEDEGEDFGSDEDFE